MDFYAATDSGRARKDNQDCFFADDKTSQLFIVCDGMGGHAAGNIASRTATESISRYILENRPYNMNPQNAEKLLGGAVKYANKIIYARSLSDKEYEGMGTTSDICFIDIDKLYFAHVGDSRIYIMRNGDLIQLTQDHTLVNQMVEDGIITQEQAMLHPDRHIITKALGTEKSIDYDFGECELHDDDIILMCSDGLVNMVEDKDIKINLISNDAKTAVKTLVDTANQNGGLDNITIIVIKV